MITIQESWRRGSALLRNSPSPSLDARLLLEHVLCKDHAYLVAHGDQKLNSLQQDEYFALVERAAGQEPIPYLIGRVPFFGFDFAVSPHVLIPRPETELMVEKAIEWGRTRGAVRLVDVGTGSGCIAISLAAHLPNAQVLGVDISAEALRLASENRDRLSPGRVSFVRADLLEPFGYGFDCILANLPYISEDEWPELADGVKFFEPALALYGGTDGFDVIRRLLPQAAERLNPGGMILLEIGWRQGEKAREYALKTFPSAIVQVCADYAGHDRLIVIQTDEGS